MAYDLDDSDEPLYQRVGREPLSDVDEDAAVAAYLADFPAIAGDELQRWGAERLIRRRNAEARAHAEAEAAGTTLRAIRQASDERRRGEAAQRAAEELKIARRIVAGEGAPTVPAATDGGYPSLEQIEVQRRKLAADGKPHGYDALGGKGTGHPFPGQRSTIRRRYRGLAPPGSPIAGICEHAPEHQHPAN